MTNIKELKTYMSANKGNDSNRALLIVVMAILYKNSDLLCELQQVLAAEGLIQNLYGAMCIILNGKSSLFKIEIEWTDSHFPNKYDYLNRFFGEFAWEQTREILYAAKIIAMSDKVRFEELAYKDKTRLILLNVLSYRLDINEKMSDTLITKLMRDGDDLQANIGFYHDERKGVFTWDERQEEIFLNIVAALPKRFCKQLYNYLEKESKKLMVSKLDEMVRFSIYLEDKRQWDICRGMIVCLRNSV